MRDDNGITGLQAPDFRVPNWLSNVDSDLRIAEIAEPVIYLFCFQAWCSGCHQHGFPTLRSVRESLRKKKQDDQVKFVMVQTVFEGHNENTAEAAQRAAHEHELDDLPLGHDSGTPPRLMLDYRTGGTPWVVIIGPRPDRIVLFNDFHADPGKLATAIQQTLASL